MLCNISEDKHVGWEQLALLWFCNDNRSFAVNSFASQYVGSISIGDERASLQRQLARYLLFIASFPKELLIFFEQAGSFAAKTSDGIPDVIEVILVVTPGTS